MSRPHLRDPKLERFWRVTVAKWTTSRLNIRDYCRLHRLQEPSFYHWRREIAARDGTPIAQSTSTPTPHAATRRSSASTPPAGPTPVTPQPRSKAAPRPNFVALRVVADTPLELVLRTGHVLRVPPGYAANHLRVIVAALESQPC